MCDIRMEDLIFVEEFAARQQWTDIVEYCSQVSRNGSRFTYCTRRIIKALNEKLIVLSLDCFAGKYILC